MTQPPPPSATEPVVINTIRQTGLAVDAARHGWRVTAARPAVSTVTAPALPRDGQKLDRAVEPVPSRALDPHGFQRPLS